jgi:hypothetical protein
MNIIEAWKSAKGGNKIHRTVGVGWLTKHECKSLGDFFADISDAGLLADDWEVVKEKKEEKVKVVWHIDCTGTVAPCCRFGNFNWGSLVGKETDLVITWEE